MVPGPALGQLYRTMVLIRRFEERCEALYAAGEIYGSLHLCIGQEATVTGACAVLRPDDLMTCTYRGHGAALAKGVPARACMAELFGRQTGCCAGRGGSMHFADVSVGHLGAKSIVAAGTPIAVGAALASRLEGSDRVVLTFFGEGATNQGVFHEALNLAAVWAAPCIFFCENNQYAEMTAFADTARVPVAQRGASHDIPGVIVDGNDVEAVYRVTADAVARARRGGGPTLIDAQTYRFSGHMYGDPGAYRPPGEMDVWRQRDPLALARHRLLSHGVLESEISALEAAAEAVVDDAVAFARESSDPMPQEVTAGIYA
jgi:pyruvate dehydrogenase E1 component alpha subunit